MKTFTFYSFKGGVGRTALMMHLAYLWADRGRVVVVVDMDLQAPGLTYSPLLRPHHDPNLQDRGISDLLATFYTHRDPEKGTFGFYPPSKLLREMRPTPPGSKEEAKWGSNGCLLALPAGRVTLPQPRAFDEATRLNIPAKDEGGVEEEETPDQRALRIFGRLFIEDISKYRPPGTEQEVDYLLIDCRTGYPELVDLTMGYMADKLVLVSGLNDQNLEGLDYTLTALRHRRIKPYAFASQALIAFSPTPVHLHDDPHAVEALRKGIKVVEKARHKSDDITQDEVLPPMVTLPYTPHLAVSDTPVPRERLLGRLHPYWQGVEEIAERLDGALSNEEVTSDVQRKAKQVIGLDRDRSVEATPTEKTDERDRTKNVVKEAPPNLTHLWQLPKWHWPFYQDKKRLEGFLEKLPIEHKRIGVREQFLDGLCASVSLPVDEKKRMLDGWLILSSSQIDDMLNLFTTELQQRSNTDESTNPDLLGQLFRAQQEWAELLLGGKGQGQEAMLLRPMRGEGAFPHWARHGLPYWKLLIQALENDPALTKENQGLLEEAAQQRKIPAEGRLFILSRLPQPTSDQTAPVLSEYLKSPPALPQWDKILDLARLIHTHWPMLDEMLNPWVDDLRTQVRKKGSAIDWHFFGYLLEFLERYEEAEAAYIKAIDINPKDASPWNNLGNLLTDHMGRHDEAEAAYKQAIDINPKLAIPWNGLGNLLTQHLRRYDEAEAAYKKAIHINPKLALPWNGLGNLLTQHLGRYDEAEAAFKKAIDSDPKFATPWNNLGNLLTNHLGRYDEAEAAYKKALDINPKYATPWYNLGNLLTQHLGRHEEAEAAFKKTIEINPKSALSWNNLGILLTKYLGRRDEAEAAFKKAIDIDPKDATPWNGLGLMFFTLGACQKAMEHLAKGLSVEPNYPYLLMNQGHGKLLLAGEGWKEDLAKALEGFESDKRYAASGFDNRLWIATELDLPQRLPSTEEMNAALSRWSNVHYIPVRIGLARLALGETESGWALLQRGVTRIDNHTDHAEMIENILVLACARPSLWELFREAARKVYFLPPEHARKLKGGYQPFRLERFLPFVEGTLTGPEDPKLQRMLCKDAAPRRRRKTPARRVAK